MQLLAVSFATVFVPLEPRVLHALIALGSHRVDGKVAPPFDQLILLEQLEEHLTALIARFPNGVFARLGSGAPRDSPEGKRLRFRCRTGKDVVRVLSTSEKTLVELVRADEAGEDATICLREYQLIPRHEEFRVFIRDREVVGASQYHHRENMTSAYAKHNDDYRFALDNFFRDELEPALPVDTVVADCWLHGRRFGNVRMLSGRLIDLNPWSYWTDAKLFSWPTVNNWPKNPYEFRFKSHKG